MAAAFYSGTLTTLGMVIAGTWHYAARGHRLLSEHLSPEEARRIGRRYLVGPSVYGLATAVALVAPWVAVGLFVLLNAFYLWPRNETVPGGDTEDRPAD